MTDLPHRPRAALAPAALALTLLCASAQAQTQAPAAAPEPAAHRFDLSAAAVAPLATALAEDLAPLLQAAQYARSKDRPDAPRNTLTSVRRLADALRAHDGLAYVALAERVDGGDAVRLKTLYLLEGAPIAERVDAPPTTAAAPGKAAVYLDLANDAGQALLAPLGEGLGALLPHAGAAPAATAEAAIGALRGPGQVGYVVLAERAGPAAVDTAAVFVVPDVVRISIQDDAPATRGAGGMAGGSEPMGADDRAEAPEVEVIADPDGGPPLIKFEFDPAKYDVTKPR